MDSEANKTIARRFVERIDARDLDGALALLSDDATYWILGRKDAIPSAGPHRKEGIARIFRLMDEQLKDGLRMRTTGSIAEGDKVALEAVSRGELRNGRVTRTSTTCCSPCATVGSSR
jgi:ketosteroid isomerase-like protein